MKVFISYSHQDSPFVQRLRSALQAENIETWVGVLQIQPGDNIIERISAGIEECDHVIVVLSPNYTNSKAAMQELGAFTMHEVAQGSARIISVLIEDCEIPFLLQVRQLLDFRSTFDEPVQSLIRALKGKPERREPKASQKVTDKGKFSAAQFQIDRLRLCLRSGELTLVCGAGVSVAAGVPTWPVLLNELLASLFRKKLGSSKDAHQTEQRLAELYREYVNPSPIIVAQYLKNSLGDDFLQHMRAALYGQPSSDSELLDAIAEICRPQRSGHSLHSIITFNFDDLVEHTLQAQHILHRSVFAEGQKASIAELPIYHVHGYLPRDGEITPEHQIVFSEDAYHSQFIDPFSWGNLIQLSHFGHNVCLFVGLSLTDPNLRRLLDVTKRKNPNQEANHYIIKKRYDQYEIAQKISRLGMAGDIGGDATDFVRVVEVLEETDANNLGMNVIWIHEYSEIPGFLCGIVQSDNT